MPRLPGTQPAGGEHETGAGMPIPSGRFRGSPLNILANHAPVADNHRVGSGTGVRRAARSGGKSGLRRTRWWVTPTVREDRESATESKPPNTVRVPGLAPLSESCGKGETVR
jgi:hypothetical protein